MPKQLRPGQLSLIPNQQVDFSRIDTLRQATGLSMANGAYTLDKQIAPDIDMSVPSFSKWRENLDRNWAHLQKLMKVCNSDIPLLWMLDRMGYDVASLRKRESEYERLLRLKEEELAHERLKYQTAIAAMRDAMNNPGPSK